MESWGQSRVRSLWGALIPLALQPSSPHLIYPLASVIPMGPHASDPQRDTTRGNDKRWHEALVHDPWTNPAIPDKPIFSQNSPALGKALPQNLGKSPQLWTPALPIRSKQWGTSRQSPGPAGSQWPAAAATFQKLCYPGPRSSALSCPEKFSAPLSTVPAELLATQLLPVQALGHPKIPYLPWVPGPKREPFISSFWKDF